MEPPFELSQAHQWFAIELNNACWAWLESAASDLSERDSWLDAAHAARHHWRQVGNHVNLGRAECLLANVYAALGEGGAGLKFARQCQQRIDEHPEDFADWDRAFAFDCLARCYSGMGQSNLALTTKNRAAELGTAIADQDDRRVFEAWHQAGNWHGIAGLDDA